jgi:hypothetical protein
MNTLEHNSLPINVHRVDAADHTPSVSLIQSFEPKMTAKSEIDYRLKLAVGKVEKELLAHYPYDKALSVIERLRHIIKDLNYYTHKTSVAIFASPVEEKVAYLDVPVDNKIVIDEAFCIRDLVYCKKQDANYLVLQFSAASCKTWLGEGDSLQLIKSNIGAETVDTDEFLHRMDQGLSLLLNSYPLPVLVIGPQRLTGRFAHLSHHTAHVVAFIHKDLPHASEAQLLTLLQPYIGNWQQVKQQSILQQVEGAFHAGTLVQGIAAINPVAGRKNTRLLVVEKDFTAPDTGRAPSVDTPFYIRDAIDIIIQKVLESGGDVEFVETGTLKAFGRIVLIPHY